MRASRHRAAAAQDALGAVGRSTIATALERSLISVTSEVLGPTLEMCPSSWPGVALTTGS